MTMYKSICVVAILLAAFAFMSGSQPAGASAPISYASPQIVARGKLFNQNAPIPTTTILTPTQSGLYRLSVYGTVTTSTCSGSIWAYTPGWTDDSGVLGSENGILQSNGDCLGPFLSVISYDDQGGAVVTFEAKGGTAITYSVSQSGSPDGSAYSLYYTLERLE
jgi:hypothetical protein